MKMKWLRKKKDKFPYGFADAFGQRRERGESEKEKWCATLAIKMMSVKKKWCLLQVANNERKKMGLSWTVADGRFRNQLNAKAATGLWDCVLCSIGSTSAVASVSSDSAKLHVSVENTNVISSAWGDETTLYFIEAANKGTQTIIPTVFFSLLERLMERD